MRRGGMIVTEQEGGAKLVELLGVRGSPEAYRVRDFLQRSTVRFRWTELTTDEEARREAGSDGEGRLRITATSSAVV
jgi:thioredoxin reductase (NADPH)